MSIATTERGRSECLHQNHVIVLFTDPTRRDCLGYQHLVDRYERYSEPSLLRENLLTRHQSTRKSIG